MNAVRKSYENVGEVKKNEPESECWAEAALAMSSATKEVATLRRGMLKSLEMMLKMDTETPAEANSTVPTKAMIDKPEGDEKKRRSSAIGIERERCKPSRPM